MTPVDMKEIACSQCGRPIAWALEQPSPSVFCTTQCAQRYYLNQQLVDAMRARLIRLVDNCLHKWEERGPRKICSVCESVVFTFKLGGPNVNGETKPPAGPTPDV